MGNFSGGQGHLAQRSEVGSYDDLDSNKSAIISACREVMILADELNRQMRVNPFCKWKLRNCKQDGKLMIFPFGAHEENLMDLQPKSSQRRQLRHAYGNHRLCTK